MWENSDIEHMSNTLPPRDAEIAEQRDEISRIVSSTRDEPEWENAVYVLKCHTPDNEAELQRFKEKVDAFTEYSSYDIKALVADEIYYVGWTNRPIERILDHLRAEDEGAQFTKVYQPLAVKEIRWFQSSEAAKQAEGSVAGEYTHHQHIDKLTEDPILIQFIRPITGLMEHYASRYMQKKDGKITKQDVFNKWKDEFLNRYIKDMVESGVFEEQPPEMKDAYEIWLNSDPFAEPDSPHELLETEYELLEYWNELCDRVSDHVNELNDTYHSVVYKRAKKPIKYAYSL